MAIERTANGRVEIAYETFGAPGGEPMLLVMGLGMQMLLWPDDFCTALVEVGFTIARYDNRDVGLSTHLREAGTPSLLSVVARPAAVVRYHLEDMADDGIAVLDALGWTSAHVLGVSMGGMIAQTMAIRHPSRVRSLTSIMSTPSTRIGRPRLRAMALLAAPPVWNREAAGRRMVRTFRIIGSPRYPHDDAWLRDVGRRAYDRSNDRAGAARQLAAINASTDRRPGLSRIEIPTLVLHGEADPMVGPSGGRATAAAVPRARLVTYPGMGHDLPRALWPDMISEIRAVTAEDATRS